MPTLKPFTRATTPIGDRLLHTTGRHHLQWITELLKTRPACRPAAIAQMFLALAGQKSLALGSAGVQQGLRDVHDDCKTCRFCRFGATYSLPMYTIREDCHSDTYLTNSYVHLYHVAIRSQFQDVFRDWPEVCSLTPPQDNRPSSDLHCLARLEVLQLERDASTQCYLCIVAEL